MFKHGMAWSHKIKKVLKVVFGVFICLLFICLFIISETHSHFSKRSEVDLYVTR